MSAPLAREAAARLEVALGERGYPILVGPGLLNEAGRHLRSVLARPIAYVVTDENVARLHLEAFEAGLARDGIQARRVVLPAGEGTKDFDHLARLADALLDAGCERADTLVALGGGVIGDLVGFTASILRRGMAFVQVPTTLLAQVDSSVGGKTGINTRHGKNLVGTFHQPRLVLADTGTLDTLPRRELLAGYAEVAKYALIDDAPFFAWLEKNGAALVAGDHAARRHAIVTCCAMKARIVAADERETGERALLNLGHTFGHALEAEAGFGDALLHGEAVAAGMVLAFRLAARLGICPEADALRVARHLAALGLPTDLTRLKGPGWTAERLVGHMRHDKKVAQGLPTLVLARGVGRAFLTRDVEWEALRAYLTDALAGKA
jgi:3-dehydroquinate synthase